MHFSLNVPFWLSLCLSWTTSLIVKKLTHGTRHHASYLNQWGKRKSVSLVGCFLLVFFPHVSPWPVSLWNKVEISRLLSFLSRIPSYLWKWDFLGKDHKRGQCFLCPVPELQKRVHRPGLLHSPFGTVYDSRVCTRDVERPGDLPLEWRKAAKKGERCSLKILIRSLGLCGFLPWVV